MGLLELSIEWIVYLTFQSASTDHEDYEIAFLGDHQTSSDLQHWSMHSTDMITFAFYYLSNNFFTSFLYACPKLPNDPLISAVHSLDFLNIYIYIYIHIYIACLFSASLYFKF